MKRWLMRPVPAQGDGFDRYLAEQRTRMGVLTPAEFWADFLAVLAGCVSLCLFVIGFAIAAPVFRAFFFGLEG